MRKWRMTAVLMLVGAGLVAGVAYATHQFPTQLPPQSAANGFLVSNSRLDHARARARLEVPAGDLRPGTGLQRAHR